VPYYTDATLVVLSDDKPMACLLVDFLQDNQEGLDKATLEAIRDLPVGGRVALGGGACPAVVVERTTLQG